MEKAKRKVRPSSENKKTDQSSTPADKRQRDKSTAEELIELKLQ